MSQAAAGPGLAIVTPSLARRLACFAYEGVLLFGVLMMAAYLYGSLTQQRHALQGQLGLQLFLFLVLGIYFGWFWSRSGQTLAMKTWHIKVLTRDGQRLSQQRAIIRYLASWLWFVPALAVCHAMGLGAASSIFAVIALGIALYVLAARMHPSRQYVHDLICQTQLVCVKPPGKAAA